MSAILVIGAGPAGLMAAVSAASGNAKVIVLEKMDRPGIKFSLTGNGRGNLTNLCDTETFMEAFGKKGRFLRQALHALSSRGLVEFFLGLNIETVEEENQKVFVKSGRATDAVIALADHARKSGAEIRPFSPVVKLLVEKECIRGVELKGHPAMEGNAVILAVGGASYPVTGSSGDGFLLAAEAGHKIIPLTPALVPIETRDKDLQALQGISLLDAEVTLMLDNRRVVSRRGSVLFTHFGLSGPAVLSLSGAIAETAGKKPMLLINLAPGTNPCNDLQADFERHGRMAIINVLKKRFPERLSAMLLKRAEIPLETPVHQIKQGQRDALGSHLQGMACEVTGTRPLAEAMVTRGGVDLKEVNPRTMESRLVKGLYFAGEVLDLDGDTGGFNLQAAFSTGFLAGLSAISG